jgi:hypothetical protein
MQINTFRNKVVDMNKLLRSGMTKAALSLGNNALFSLLQPNALTDGMPQLGTEQ